MYREHSAAVARRKQQQQQQHQEAGPESLEVVDKERMKEVVMEQVRVRGIACVFKRVKAVDMLTLQMEWVECWREKDVTSCGRKCVCNSFGDKAAKTDTCLLPCTKLAKLYHTWRALEVASFGAVVSAFSCCSLHVRKHFRPEFVNRVDEFIIFEPLRWVEWGGCCAAIEKASASHTLLPAQLSPPYSLPGGPGGPGTADCSGEPNGPHCEPEAAGCRFQASREAYSPGECRKQKD
eukprot:scaffold101834_cov19-Tisochrysis_lutea.AAC.1